MNKGTKPENKEEPFKIPIYFYILTGIIIPSFAVMIFSLLERRQPQSQKDYPKLIAIGAVLFIFGIFFYALGGVIFFFLGEIILLVVLLVLIRLIQLITK
ncbi:MAG: hypothetical protein KGI00_03310 [Candidatus Micrarchaeota archaeon]|nr:hypothetical protein [Candidatus Micrarchaeota archaeon]MDE1849733.1 hypothetical protein [Candidatus Micrarchaeota archaeon]